MDAVPPTLLAALRQALSAGGESRLYRSGKLDGLFPSRHGPSAEAAAGSLRDGLLEIVRTETRGKTCIEWARITPRGVDFLHQHESPLAALHDLRQVLRHNQTNLPSWIAQLRQIVQNIETHLQAETQAWQQRLAALERRVDEALRRLEASGPLVPRELAEAHPWSIDALNYLDRRRSGGGGDDCPLPELFAAVARHHPE